MNIFVVSEAPVDCAKALDDRRLNTMTLETTRLLSTAVRLVTQPVILTVKLYKITHADHPCAVWVRLNRANFLWTVKLGVALAKEYEHRFDRVHACLEVIDNASLFAHEFPAAGQLSPRPNVTPYPDLPVKAAYRHALAAKWNTQERPPVWTKRSAPLWYHGACA